MVTVMLVSIPKGSGAGFAGRPLKNLTSGALEMTDGTTIPVDKDIFTTLEVGSQFTLDGVVYEVKKVSTIMPTMGKVIVEPQE